MEEREVKAEELLREGVISGETYVDIATDFYLLDDEDNILTGKQDFGRFTFQSPIANTEFKLDLNYTITDMPGGIYNFQTVIRDVNSGKSTKFTKKIRLK